MPTVKTESRAVNVLSGSIDEASLMKAYIDQNDKTPIWDGFIYLYTSSRLTKDCFAGRAPIQVKGHDENDLSQASVRYSAAVADLTAYKKDGGVIYFLVYVASDRRASKIYYAALTAEKLQKILESCTPGQEKKVICLDEFPEDNDEKTRIVREFLDQYQPASPSRPYTAPREPAFEKFPVLRSLTCRRLTADPDNFNKLQSLKLKTNPGVEAYMKYLAWEEDTQGQCAYYLIQDENQEILMMFGLKAGLLYRPFDLDKLKQQEAHSKRLFQAFGNQQEGKLSPQDQELIRQAENSGIKSVREAYPNLREIQMNLEIIKMDDEVTPDSGTVRADKTYPAVELFDYFRNDAAREQLDRLRDQLGGEYPVGQVLFWTFVVPTISKAFGYMGCQYVYTFVADSSTNNVLVRYYEEKLNFTCRGELSVVKPEYDFCCPCRYQSVTELLKYREEFFQKGS